MKNTIKIVVKVKDKESTCGNYNK
ncbi:methanobactin-like peptide MovA [Xenorhabdus yunnanensis]